jgi:mono/diheme cytochrome c family protein
MIDKVVHTVQESRRSLARCAAAALFALAALFGTGASSSADDFTYGRRIFLDKADCAFCHGWAVDGAGHPQAVGRSANLRQTRLSRDQLITVIMCDIPGTAMP